MALGRTNKTILSSGLMHSGMLLNVLASDASFVKGGAQECSDDQGCLTIAKLLGHRDCSQNASLLSVPPLVRIYNLFYFFLFQTKILNISPRERGCGCLRERNTGLFCLEAQLRKESSDSVSAGCGFLPVA